MANICFLKFFYIILILINEFPTLLYNGNENMLLQKEFLPLFQTAEVEVAQAQNAAGNTFLFVTPQLGASETGVREHKELAM